jgi:ribosomal-protein-alanine N-acetyltransferase
MLRRAERRSLAAIMLEVREHNEAAIALYDEAGFVPVGRRRGYYERPREDAILMTQWMDEEEKA